MASRSRFPVLLVAGAVAVCGATTGRPSEALPPCPAPPEEWQGLEEGEWQVEAYGNPAAVRALKGATGGLLHVEYTNGEKDKVVLKRVVDIVGSEKGSVRAWVYCPMKAPPRVALALCTGPTHLWHESPPARLATGWNELRFDLAAERWKRGTETHFDAPLADREDLRSLQFLVFAGNSGGLLYLEAVRIDEADVGPRVAELIGRLGAESFDEREEADRAIEALGRRALPGLRAALRSEDAEIAARAAALLRRLAGTTTAEKPPAQTAPLPDGVFQLGR